MKLVVEEVLAPDHEDASASPSRRVTSPARGRHDSKHSRAGSGSV